MRDPYVIAVVESHRWWKERQLAEQWGGAIPHVIKVGVSVYDAALRAVLNHDMRRDQERRDRDAQARLDEMQHGPMPHRPFHRRR